jgi:hypothetical protein
MGCTGVKWSDGLGVTASGWVHLAGQHIPRPELRRLLERKGAVFHEEFCNQTDLLILGELRPYQLQDDRVGGADSIDELVVARQSGSRHVHLVFHDDLADLLNGSRVPCRQVPSSWKGRKKRARTSTRRGRP